MDGKENSSAFFNGGEVTPNMTFELSSNYRPSVLLKNGHFNTIYTSILKKQPLTRSREKRDTSDGDFYYADWIRGDNRRLAIALHGLEGSSDSNYIIRISNLLAERNWDVCGLNFRSCLGPMNKTQTLYHSGFTFDLHELIEAEADNYDEIFLIGYSLGGNVVMKYLGDGEHKLSGKLKGGVGISVPCDLAGCSDKLTKWYNRLYDKQFLHSLMIKMKAKASDYPLIASALANASVKTLKDFDNHFTGPLHGFKDAADYYAQSSCLQYLDRISLPSIIISSLDDPLLSDSCYPIDTAQHNPNFNLITTRHGGHVGFARFGSNYYWIDYQIEGFLESHSIVGEIV